jgi:hypothetical protein
MNELDPLSRLASRFAARAGRALGSLRVGLGGRPAVAGGTTERGSGSYRGGVRGKDRDNQVAASSPADPPVATRWAAPAPLPSPDRSSWSSPR